MPGAVRRFRAAEAGIGPRRVAEGPQQSAESRATSLEPDCSVAGSGFPGAGARSPRRARRSGPARTGYRRPGWAGRRRRGESATGWTVAGSRLNVLTGSSERTHVSLLPPPFCIETTRVSAEAASRVKPAGHDRIARIARPPGRRGARSAAGCRPPLVQDRGRGECQLLLSDELVRPGLDGLGQCRELRPRSAPRRRSARTAATPTVGLITICGRLARTWLERGGVAAPPGRDRGDLQLLAQQVAADAGEIGQQRGRLDQAAPQRIGHRHVPRTHRLDQPRDAQERVAAQLQRIAIRVVQPAEDDVDRLEPAEQLEVDPVVADRQVAPFDQRDSPGIGRGRRARSRSRCTGPGSGARSGDCRDRGGRSPAGSRAGSGRRAPAAGPGSRGRSRAASARARSGSRAHSPRPRAPESGPPGRRSSRRARARRRPRRGGGSRSRGSFRPWQGRRNPGWPKTSCGGRMPPAEQRLRPVQVGQDQVQQPRPLDQAGLDRRGVRRRDQERERIELPGPVHAPGGRRRRCR